VIPELFFTLLGVGGIAEKATIKNITLFCKFDFWSKVFVIYLNGKE